jgi:hypothetical protein
MTRTGKIARLPQEIREQLNRRLQDGEQGKRLVGWLNALPAVKAVLRAEFAGQSITAQNLSEWRKGGYRDWQLQQEALALVQTISADAAALRAVSEEALTDKLALWLVARYAVAAKSLNDPADWRRLREFCQDLVELRKGDHSAERLRLERERWEAEQEKAAKAAADQQRLAPLLGMINRKTLLSTLGIAPLDSPVGWGPLTEEELLPLILAKFATPSSPPGAAIQPNPSESK